jgi:hypothetical protein
MLKLFRKEDLVPIIIFGTEIFFTSTELITILYAWVITLPLGYEAGSVTQIIACGNEKRMPADPDDF